MPAKKMYIMTRFNIALHKHPDRYDYDSYMRSRIDWFKKTTVPSVKNQTCKNFEWLVLIDSETPEKWKSEITSIDGFRTIEIDSDRISDAVGDKPQQQIGLEAMKQVKYSKDDMIITSRLDNDDCIARHYVWRVRKSLDKHKQGVSFVQGYYWYHASKMKGRFYKSRYKNNMFPSVIERGDCVRTVFEIDHPRLKKRFNMQYQEGGEMWLYNWIGKTNLQNFTSRFAKRSGFPRCQGATMTKMNVPHIEKVFGVKTRDLYNP